MIVGQRIKVVFGTYNIALEEAADYLNLSKDVLMSKLEGNLELFYEDVIGLLDFLNSKLPNSEKLDLNGIFGWDLR